MECSRNYGHLLCQVIHRCDVLCKSGDVAATSSGACHLAEQNVERLYSAEALLETHYRRLDSTDFFSPGIGKLTSGDGSIPRTPSDRQTRPVDNSLS
jgi:hypothetical protein